MPIPTFTGLPPNPEFKDIVNKFNKLTAEMQNLFLSLDSLNVVSLTADHIDAGTLDAGVVTIRGEDGTVFYQIDSTGIVANNGTIDTLKFDLATGLLTLISAIFKSATGFPRVEINSTDNLIAAYQSATNFLKIRPNVAGAPTITFDDGTTTSDILNFSGADFYLLIRTTQKLRLESGGSITIDPGVNLIFIPDWDQLHSTGDAQNLQQALDAKANGSGINGTVYVAATSGGATTTAITFTNGVRTA